MQTEGETHLLMDVDISTQTRLPQIQDPAKESSRGIGNVCGDKAYSSRENAELVAKRGGRPFLMPKENASSKAKGHQAWKEMMRYREEHPKAFENRYHKRSNSESTNSSFKRKYGEFLYSRKWNTQKREARLKVITYNLRLLIRYRIREQLKLWD